MWLYILFPSNCSPSRTVTAAIPTRPSWPALPNRHREQLALLVTKRAYSVHATEGRTWHLDSVNVGLFETATHRQDVRHFSRRYILTFPPAKTSGSQQLERRGANVGSIRASSKIWRLMFQKFPNESETIQLCFPFIFASFLRLSNVPECVTDAILEVNEVVAVDPHQVSAVEVQISFLQNIAESFPLSLFLVLDIANKRGNTCDL